MAHLVYQVESESTLKQILQAIRPYMRGLAYKSIEVISEGKTRVLLERSNEGYLLFGRLLTPDMILKRYSKVA